MGIMHDPRMSAEEHHSFNVLGTHALLELCAQLRREEGGRALLRQRLRPAPGQLELPHRGRAAHGGASRFSRRARPHRGRHVRAAFFWKHPDIETVILRPVHIVGPDVKNAPSNYLRLARPVRCSGFDPMVQLIHEEDVARALVLALRPGAARRLQRDRPRRGAALRGASASWARRPSPCRTRSPGRSLGALFKYRLASFPPGSWTTSSSSARGRLARSARGWAGARATPCARPSAAWREPRRGSLWELHAPAPSPARRRRARGVPPARRAGDSIRADGEIRFPPRPAWAAEPRSTTTARRTGREHDAPRGRQLGGDLPAAIQPVPRTRTGSPGRT